LVIGPKNAFAAWDEQLAECLPQVAQGFTRLRGGRDAIRQLLALDPQFMLISYQQLTRVADVIAAHCSEYPTHIFLDESHRIKSGTAKVTARAALDLCYVAAGKLILSGTPMPQSVADLVPQVNFLYPELAADESTVADLIRPIYVRTTKAELGLPPVDRSVITVPMAPMQGRVYSLLRNEAARVVANLNLRSSQGLRTLGRSIIRLLYIEPSAVVRRFRRDKRRSCVCGVVGGRRAEAQVRTWTCSVFSATRAQGVDMVLIPRKHRVHS
jgi:SNF2 family DNA or RNA helicase